MGDAHVNNYVQVAPASYHMDSNFGSKDTQHSDLVF